MLTVTGNITCHCANTTCHCEERSDEAIPRPVSAPASRAEDCFVATLLAMTEGTLLAMTWPAGR